MASNINFIRLSRVVSLFGGMYGECFSLTADGANCLQGFLTLTGKYGYLVLVRCVRECVCGTGGRRVRGVFHIANTYYDI